MNRTVRGVVKAMRWKRVEEGYHERVDSGVVAIYDAGVGCDLQHVLARAWNIGCRNSGCAHYADTLPTFYKKMSNGWQMGSADKKVWILWKKDSDKNLYGYRIPQTEDDMLSQLSLSPIYRGNNPLSHLKRS